jgi:hypothetical protein
MFSTAVQWTTPTNIKSGDKLQNPSVQGFYSPWVAWRRQPSVQEVRGFSEGKKEEQGHEKK